MFLEIRFAHAISLTKRPTIHMSDMHPRQPRDARTHRGHVTLMNPTTERSTPPRLATSHSLIQLKSSRCVTRSTRLDADGPCRPDHAPCMGRRPQLALLSPRSFPTEENTRTPFEFCGRIVGVGPGKSTGNLKSFCQPHLINQPWAFTQRPPYIR